MGGRVVEPLRTELSLVGNKALRSAISLTHTPAKIPKGTSSQHGTCFHQVKTPNTVFLGIHPSDRSASLPVVQGPSQSGSLKAKQDESAPPAPVHLVDPTRLIHQAPIKAAPQAWQCASNPDRVHTTPQ